MTAFEKRSRADWEALAQKELRDKKLADLAVETAEGVDVKPLYTAADLPAQAEAELPGFAPFTRGVRATMYAGRPWTVRQYAGFSTAEASNALDRKSTRLNSSH